MNGKTEVIANIIEDIADIPIDEITEDSSFIDDLDLASIEIMSIVAEVERKYSIKLSETELLEIRTVGELAEIIEKKRKS